MAVSRVHAFLEHVGPGWCLEDVGSTNGTQVNGGRILAPRMLLDRDEILVGRTRLVMHDPSSRGDVTTEPLRAAPARTPGEQRVLIELCRPVLSGQAFTPPSSVRSMAEALFVSESAIKQHLDRLYDKFGISTAPVDRGESAWPTRPSRARPLLAKTFTKTADPRRLPRGSTGGKDTLRCP